MVLNNSVAHTKLDVGLVWRLNNKVCMEMSTLPENEQGLWEPKKLG